MTQPGVFPGVQWINGSRAHQRGSSAHPDLVCFSHLRWDFVFQRPQHLMTRFARDRRVFFIEEPVRDSEAARMDIQHDPSGVLVVVPHLPDGLTPAQESSWMRLLVERLLLDANCRDFVSGTSPRWR